MSARTAVSAKTDVYLEVGKKRVFACAFDWPGWTRSGRDEASALDALLASLPRFRLVTKEAGLAAPSERLVVVERVPGSASTDFGVPGAIPSRDADLLTATDARRWADLVRAVWTVFDRTVAGAPAELRKGPRGGGRDRDKIVEHVTGAEAEAYAPRIGVHLKPPAIGDATALEVCRSALLEAIQHPVEEAKWPPRYAARRIAWHALDHAWEIEDRSVSESRQEN
jgi:hypothetical protein